jgi:hypothetical protein
MRYSERRPAPFTICLVGAPGHAESVYLSKEIKNLKINSYEIQPIKREKV